MKDGIFPFERFLKDYDVWEFHPMDQGGRLVQLQLIDSEKDVDIVAALQRPGFFAPWGDPIQWDRLEATEVEKSVWLNRWYYLPCFARLYWRSGNRSYLDNLMKLFRQWTLDNPVPDDLHAHFRSRKYIWRDMQVAWRTQNLIWCYFLGQRGYTETERRELLNSIQTHAHVLMAYFGEQPLSFGNHQSHGALGMLHISTLFPEFANAETMQTVALKILNHHLEAAYFEDGNSVELCPGYYPFMAANFRDAYLLCAANGIKLSPRWVERLTQFHQFMFHCQQPDGTTPPINDSTEVPVRASLDILGEVLALPTVEQPPTSSFHFSHSDQAVMRDGHDGYLFLDAASGTGSLFHWHGGKLGFHYWQGGQPYIVDSGVCNYDEPLRKAWYISSSAHNTILIDGLGDTELTKSHSPKTSEVGSCLIDWQSTAEYDLATMVNTAFRAVINPVTWTRYLVMLKRRFVVIVDHLESTGAHEYQWLFHLAQPIVKTDTRRSRLLTGTGDHCLLLAPFNPNLFDQMKVDQQHINKRGRNIRMPATSFIANASDICAAFLLLPLTATELPDIELELTADDNGMNLNIHTKHEKTRLYIPYLSAEAVANRKESAVLRLSTTPVKHESARL